MPSVGPLELVIILAIAIFVIGPKRLPAATRSIGEGIRDLKDTVRGVDPREDLKDAIRGVDPREDLKDATRGIDPREELERDPQRRA